jgi:transposase
LTLTRFETAPGQQNLVDCGQVRVALRDGATTLQIFVLTPGFSRRGFYWAYPDERLTEFLETHERALNHCGGLTAEQLYDHLAGPSGTRPVDMLDFWHIDWRRHEEEAIH